MSAVVVAAVLSFPLSSIGWQIKSHASRQTDTFLISGAVPKMKLTEYINDSLILIMIHAAAECVHACINE